MQLVIVITTNTEGENWVQEECLQGKWHKSE